MTAGKDVPGTVGTTSVGASPPYPAGGNWMPIKPEQVQFLGAKTDMTAASAHAMTTGTAQASIPDRCKLVPRIATRKMVEAADACVDAYSAWAAMVAAVEDDDVR